MIFCAPPSVSRPLGPTARSSLVTCQVSRDDLAWVLKAPQTRSVDPPLQTSQMSARPENIGIKAMEVYIPSQYVDQAELEKFDNIPTGKYTIGLGQTKMGFVNDREDTYSMALTVVSQLLKENNIDPNSIGRLEVGTETLLDKSKSAKSVLMQLFGDNGDIEGIDTYNACYGGTSALFNSINWVESSSWDGRLAIVVTGDIAIYAKGAARPTGGAGMVAMLIGPDAPLVVDPHHGTYMENAYDFYKPDFTSEYPVVDGHFSLTCYTRALDQAYKTWKKKSKNTKGVESFDACAFHVPTCKLVTKSFARLHYDDYLDGAEFDVPAEIKSVSYEDSLTDRNIEKAFLQVSKEVAKTKLSPSLQASTNVGNIYTGSVYLSLASLLTFGNVKKGDVISLFSYGSGLAASFFTIRVNGDISKLVENIGLKKLLDDREELTPQQYEESLGLREKAHLQKGFKPSGDTKHLRKGTYYLTEVDDKFRRSYGIA